MSKTVNLGRVVGKSAYEQAKEGGYAGTEAEFNTLMANPMTETKVDERVNTYLAESKIEDGTVFNDLTAGVVLFTIDGMDEETYDAIVPYADSLGIPITCFYGTITDSLLAKIHADSYNNCYGIYTAQPKETYQGTNNYAEQYDQFETQYQAFLKNGLGRPMFASYAGGIHGSILENILHKKGIKLARTTTAGVIDAPTQDMFNLLSTQLSDTNCTTQVESTLHWNYNKIWCITVHSIASDTKTDSFYLTEENMKACLDIIKKYMDEKGLTAMNYKQFWEYFTFPHDKKNGAEITKLESDGEYHKYVKSNGGWKELML